MTLAIVGVRHHSPACARVVAHTIAEKRPRFVLVEGPSDMNDRMGELMLEHEPPIAIYSWLARPGGGGTRGGTTRGSWCPFCAYSPEWVALRAARDAGAEVLFMDLPAWHEAFAGVSNRYADRLVRASDRLGELGARVGFEDTDALWDHLFEQPSDPGEVARRLTRWFEAFRGDEPAGPRDAPREALMCRWIAWAMHEAAGAPVIVVCGGFHAPALARGWQEAPASRPEPTQVPEGARAGSTCVPYSFHRLDSFTGYASGMPSPAFYQAVWDRGAEAAGEAMLQAAIRRLRARAQRVSSADAIAAMTLAHGLKSLRGHGALARVDVLDGLAGALVKDALEAPLPWTRRGPLAARTDPLLVEVVAAFSGTRQGKLARGTPQPPIVADAFAELEAAGIETSFGSREVEADLERPEGRLRARTLHRLRVLGIPGFERTRGPSTARHTTQLSERWRVARAIETDAALIEAAAYGATLEQAARARIEERAAGASGARVLAEALYDAVLADVEDLEARILDEVARVVAQEPSFEELGAALARLIALWHREVRAAGPRRAGIGAVVVLCAERGLWLFEGVQGANAAVSDATIGAIGALRDALRFGTGELDLDVARTHALAVRRARDAGAPPGVQGAALGLLWSTRDLGAEPATIDLGALAVASLRAIGRGPVMGDWLAGLFALAREEARAAPDLVASIDDGLLGMDPNAFLVALPALRRAFAYFPPRERLDIAKLVVASTGHAHVDAADLLAPAADPATIARAAAAEAEALEEGRRYGLFDGDDHAR